MRNRVARLRIWLAGSAIFLVAVIVVYIGYGRYVSHLRHLKLPLPPGVNIVREAGGWTYSRADGSKTLYTVHAARFQQGKNGKTALHDVSVILFGKNGDRHDRVYGEEFEYDEKGGVLRALGQVHIDLENATGAKSPGQGGQASTVGGPGGTELLAPDVMHVTTSGLVFLRELGIAATSEDVDVQSGAMKGHARGADYSSDSGVLMLHSAVSISGMSAGHAVRMTAAEAQFDQRAQEARLAGATYESDGRRVSAAHAVLHRRPDGTLERVDADKDVTLTAQGGTAVAQRAQLLMNAAGQPASAVLAGGVVYTANEPLRKVRTEAADARISFAGGRKVEPEHAVLTGAVHVTERTREAAWPADAWSSRELTAAKLETWMSAGAKGRTELHTAVATGSAKLVTVDPPGARKGGAARTEVAADELKAAMSGAGGAVFLNELTGQGHTSLLQVSSEGGVQTSAGDVLHAMFEPAKRTALNGKGIAGSTTGETLASATQEGHVTMTRRVPAKAAAGAKPAGEQVQHAMADRAVYDGPKDQLLLSGSVRMTDPGDAMWAQQVLLDLATGDAHASGAVKVDYTQDRGAGVPAGEPLHIVSERADVDDASSAATFLGSPVRVWQNGNQIQAPAVVVDRSTKRLTARGAENRATAGNADAARVRTILVNATSSGRGSQVDGTVQPRCGTAKPAAVSGGTPMKPSGGAVRIASGAVVYSGTEQRVEFTGGVKADTPDGTVRSDQATAFLAPVVAGRKPAVASLEGGLERMEAAGKVELARPGTHLAGERLVYEAGDKTFVLSGGPRTPAKAVDARGTSTAAAFRFSSCDDTVEALNAAPGGTTERIETDAFVSSGRKKEKVPR